MNIKTFMAAAVAALTLAACQAETETEVVDATSETDVQLNEDGSVATEAAEEVQAQ
jgi:uncharacterized protein YcfL